jgi:competence ComEA-like helix-hairpin-helix protein
LISTRNQTVIESKGAVDNVNDDRTEGLKLSETTDVAKPNSKPNNSIQKQVKTQFFEKSLPLPTKHSIDVNQATKEQLQRLPAPKNVIRNMVKYREAGGTFRNIESLKKIYGMTDQLIQTILPYLVFEEKAKEFEHPKKNTPTLKTNVDINTASKEGLMKVYGIGEKLSYRIVKYRELLQGFHNKDQLKEVYGLSDQHFLQIESQVTLSPVSPSLKINELNAFELSRHPYLNKKEATIIKRYIEQNGPLNSNEDLKKLVILPDSIIQKLEPYLRY